MDPRPIVDGNNTGETPVAPGVTGAVVSSAAARPARQPSEVRFPGEDGGKSLAEMAERDLTATLQLLAERAQYITGATGAAIALRDQDEMVCRASAGSSAPEVGALLQVNSGLSGESVRTRETLRCDDAFSDPRVNREGCEALGIRSVVVMPLIRGEEVIGVFELFSDKPHIFENRDLVALERMGTMVHTALEHSTAALGLPPMLGEVIQPARAPQISGTLPAPARERTGAASVDFARTTSTAGEEPENGAGASGPARTGLVFHGKTSGPSASTPAYVAPVPTRPESARGAREETAPAPIDEDDVLEDVVPATSQARTAPTEVYARPARASFESLLAKADPEPILSDINGHRGPVEVAPIALPDTEEDEAPRPLSIPQLDLASLKKCQQCGFPVSEGRTLCIDCEKKSKTGEGIAPVKAAGARAASAEVAIPNDEVGGGAPSFLAGGEGEASWLSTHKFTVIAVALAAVGIVAIVALR